MIITVIIIAVAIGSFAGGFFSHDAIMAFTDKAKSEIADKLDDVSDKLS